MAKVLNLIINVCIIFNRAIETIQKVIENSHVSGLTDVIKKDLGITDEAAPKKEAPKANDQGEQK